MFSCDFVTVCVCGGGVFLAALSSIVGEFIHSISKDVFHFSQSLDSSHPGMSVFGGEEPCWFHFGTSVTCREAFTSLRSLLF